MEMQDVYAEMFYEAERLGLTRVAEAREREANLWGGGPNIDVCDSFLIQPHSKEDDSLVQRSDLPSEQWFFDEDDPDGNLLPTPALPRTGWTWTARRETRERRLGFTSTFVDNDIDGNRPSLLLVRVSGHFHSRVHMEYVDAGTQTCPLCGDPSSPERSIARRATNRTRSG